jgi:hypothetical protein
VCGTWGSLISFFCGIAFQFLFIGATLTRAKGMIIEAPLPAWMALSAIQGEPENCLVGERA